MMKSLLLLWIPALLSAAPFCGPYVGGEVGWDFLCVQERRARVSITGTINPVLEGEASGNRCFGTAWFGWMVGSGCGRLGVRVGYQGFCDLHARGDMGMGRLDKLQGGFFDVTPGVLFCNCWLAHLIVGIGYSDYRYVIDFQANESSRREVRDQKRWAPNPRVGVGLQWAFWRCLTLGSEWVHNFSADVIYRVPISGMPAPDIFHRKERTSSNQVALTLNWWFG